MPDYVHNARPRIQKLKSIIKIQKFLSDMSNPGYCFNKIVCQNRQSFARALQFVMREDIMQ